MMKSKYPSINRSQFIERLISRHKKFDDTLIQEAARKVLDNLSYSLSQGQRIEIRGFGSFCLRHRSERVARNPQTGEQFRLQRRSVPYFKPGKNLRSKVDNKDSNSPAASVNSVGDSADMPLSGLSNFD